MQDILSASFNLVNFITMAAIHPAYSAIAAYFDTWSLQQATARLEAAIRATDSEKIYHAHSPAELVFFIDNTTGLVSAVFKLMEDKISVDAAKLSKEQSDRSRWLTEYEWYCGRHKDETPWDFFPRHLTQKEFADPFKALKKFTRYMPEEQWKHTLKEILQYALSATPFYESDPGMKLIELSLLLHKLLEAAHLVEVRAIKKDEHGPRPGWEAKNPADKQSKKTKEEDNDETGAWDTISGFFDCWGGDGIREDLWKMTKSALTNAEDESSATDRSTMILLFEQLTEFADAVFVLHEGKEKKQ